VSYAANESIDGTLSKIGSSGFGNDIDAEAFIINAVKSMPKLSSVDCRMVLQDLYETEYGIYNHLSPINNRPLTSVAMFPSEDINDGSLLEEAIRTYVGRNIKETYGLNVIEFLDLPVDIMEMMIQIADEQKK
jgi:hypothetical protein